MVKKMVMTGAAVCAAWMAPAATVERDIVVYDRADHFVLRSGSAARCCYGYRFKGGPKVGIDDFCPIVV